MILPMKAIPAELLGGHPHRAAAAAARADSLRYSPVAAAYPMLDGEGPSPPHKLAGPSGPGRVSDARGRGHRRLSEISGGDGGGFGRPFTVAAKPAAC